MREQDLFLDVARQVGPDKVGVVLGPEKDRLEKQQAELQQRVTRVIDDIFIKYSSDLVGVVESDSGDCVRFTDTDTDDLIIIEGGRKTTIYQNGDELHQKELTRRWVSLDICASEKFQVFAPVDCTVVKRMLIGVHDLRFTEDGGKTWYQPPEYLANSLEVVTGFYIEPATEGVAESLRVNEVSDPFEYGPVIIERLNFVHPVFDDDDPNIFLAEPEVKHYDTPFELFVGINASIDEFEEILR